MNREQRHLISLLLPVFLLPLGGCVSNNADTTATATIGKIVISSNDERDTWVAKDKNGSQGNLLDPKETNPFVIKTHNPYSVVTAGADTQIFLEKTSTSGISRSPRVCG